MNWFYVAVVAFIGVLPSIPSNFTSLQPSSLTPEAQAEAGFTNETLDNRIEEALLKTNISTVYLTWFKTDTSNHIGVNYLSSTRGVEPKLNLMNNKNNLIQSVESEASNIKNTPLYIHSFKVENLRANSVYHFSVGDEVNGFSQILKFRTLPNDLSPIEVVQGGDMSTSSSAARLTKAAVTDHTHALLMGGDLAYADGKTSSYKKWQKWFARLNESAITPSGYMIPFILAIGNHETNSNSRNQPLKKAPFYFSLFPQSTPGTTPFTKQQGEQK